MLITQCDMQIGTLEMAAAGAMASEAHKLFSLYIINAKKN